MFLFYCLSGVHSEELFSIKPRVTSELSLELKGPHFVLKSKVPLLQRGKGGGADAKGNSLHQRGHMPTDLEGRVDLVQAARGKKPLARLGQIGQFSCRLQVARHLLCGLRTSGV